MYLEINGIFRDQFNNFNPSYKGDLLTKYYHEDVPADADGAHVRGLLFTNQPTKQEVGYAANQEVTGFIQIGAFLPATDKGLNYSLAKFANDAAVYFAPKAIVSGDIKFEILDVTKGENVRIDGFFTSTLIINFRSIVCNR